MVVTRMLRKLAADYVVLELLFQGKPSAAFPLPNAAEGALVISSVGTYVAA